MLSLITFYPEKQQKLPVMPSRQSLVFHEAASAIKQQQQQRKDFEMWLRHPCIVASQPGECQVGVDA